MSIHPTAIVAATASIPESCNVGPYCTIGPDVELGENCELVSHVVLDGKTRLDFEHIGLVPALECYDLCSNCWSYFLGSLQQLVETGRGTPWVVEQLRAA